MDMEQTFVTIVDCGSLNKAAEHLGVANSTVSSRLLALERKLKATLLQRTARGIHLTESGQLYYLKLKNIIAQLEDTENQIRMMSDGLCLRLSLSMPPGLMEYWLAEPIAEFLNLHPDAHITIRTSDRILEQFLAGHDICFHWGFPPDSNHYAKKLFNDEIKLIATERYLQTNNIHNNPEAIEFLQFTRDFSGDTKYQIVEKKYLDWFYSHPARVTCDTVEAQIALLLRNMGAAILPLSIVQPLLNENKLVDITEQYFSHPFPLSCYAITYEKPSASSAAQYLIGHIKQFFDS